MVLMDRLRINVDAFFQFEYAGNVYYCLDDPADMANIPELTLLLGFDPLIVSYAQRDAVLPPEYKNAVVLKSGIYSPTIAVNGQVTGLWNIKKGEPRMGFSKPQSTRIKNAAFGLVYNISCQTTEIV